MRIAVGIATTNRPDILSMTLLELAKQTRKPDQIFICGVSPRDIHQEAVAQHHPTRVLYSPPGLSRQRNEILSHVQDFDVLLFFDDDFFPKPNYVEELERVFTDHGDVVLTTGTLIADGVRGPGICAEKARAMLARASLDNPSRIENVFSGYGCNMAIRLSCVFDHMLRFDENLPLYGWLEDLDFTRQIAPYGRIVKVNSLRGIHLAVKFGRVSGIRYGYSQVANPIYLFRKKSIPFHLAFRRATRFCFANSVRTLCPESYIDRFGRMRGNAIAIGDLIRGKLDPRRITEL